MASDFTRRIFNYLLDRVPDDIPVTYGQVADDVGGMAYGLGQNLGVIWDFCEENNYPHLNAAVVNAKRGLPGREYTPHDHPVTQREWDVKMSAIRTFPWGGVEIN